MRRGHHFIQTRGGVGGNMGREDEESIPEASFQLGKATVSHDTMPG
jgi:hypothetical protein